MSIRVPTPSDHNHTTETFKRTLASASFLCNAQDTIAMHKMPKTKGKGRWLYRAAFVLLAGAALIVLTGCGKTPRVSNEETKLAAASTKACPGMTPVWLDSKTVECFKEKL